MKKRINHSKIFKYSTIIPIIAFMIITLGFMGYSYFLLYKDNTDTIANFTSSLEINIYPLENRTDVIIPIYIINNGFFDLGKTSIKLSLNNVTNNYNIPKIVIPSIPKHTILNSTQNISIRFDSFLEFTDFIFFLNSTRNIYIDIIIGLFWSNLYINGNISMEGLL